MHPVSLEQKAIDDHSSDAPAADAAGDGLSVLKHVAVGIYTVDATGRCATINPAALQLFGYTEAECLGQDMHQLVHSRQVDGSDYLVADCPLYQARLTGNAAYDIRETLWTKAGASLPVLCSSVPLSDSYGLRGTVITIVDLSREVAAMRHAEQAHIDRQEAVRQQAADTQELERTRLQHEASALRQRARAEELVQQQQWAEENLVRSEKLAAVGRLAASIAHEINNPLEAVTNLLYLARTGDNVPPGVDMYLQQAESELTRASEIVAQTLRFQRGGTAPVTCSPEHLVDSVLALHQGKLHHSGIRVARQHRQSNSFRCMEGDLRQILNNLVGNAIDSMRETGGEITIRTRVGQDVRSSKRGLRISVADTGHGMDKVTASQIFEPFYTTKGAAGSGLGLWISHTLAKRHGGRLAVRSTVDAQRHGTTFSLFVPELTEA